MRSAVASFLLVVALAAQAAAASADEGPRFHRTTPRGSFGRDGSALLVGVPGGRAWGIESELRALPVDPSDLHAVVEVRDAVVREAFVRIAYYARATGRPRQIALSDAPVVRAGDTSRLDVPLDPPAGAIAYRVRVLARLVTRAAVSLPDAVRADVAAPAPRRVGVPPTRLLW